MRGVPLWRGAVLRVATLVVLAAALAGCDKCGDYFWVEKAAPHSCKQTPAGG